MNRQEKRKKLRESLLNAMEKGNLNEGLLQKLLMAFLSPMIRREVKKIKNDPEIKAAEDSVKLAIDQWEISLKRLIALEKEETKRLQKAAEEAEAYLKNQ